MPVESPDSHLWHLRRDGETLCGRPAERWPVVLRAVERAGVWCGACLHATIDGLELPLRGPTR